jgi:GNAT superfamily N-acetyltransferase
VSARVAGPADVDRIVEIFVDAFYDDPGWSWGMPDPAKRRDQHAWFWRHIVVEALPHSATWLTTNGAAASVWLPPGVIEGEADPGFDFAERAREVLGADADRFLRAVDLFEAAQPRDEPHWYLSMLGTHTSEHGHGYGLGLLETNLATVDETRLPAYLEASHHSNVPLYERYGFRVRGGFDMPDGGPHITTMWRPAV